MESRLFVKPPRDPRKRLIWSSGSSFAAASIFVPLFGVVISLRENPGKFTWAEGAALCGLSLLLLLAYSLLGRKLRNPSLFYILERLPPIIRGLIFIEGGMRLIALILGFRSLLPVLAGLLFGLGMLPWRIRDQRLQFRQAVKDGYLQKSLHCRSFSWDPRHDNERWEKKESLTNPALVRRLLFWTAPAIGMGLSDLIGRASAQIVAGLFVIYSGYISIGPGIQWAVASAIELRKIEGQLGHRLRLLRE